VEHINECTQHFATKPECYTKLSFTKWVLHMESFGLSTVVQTKNDCFEWRFDSVKCYKSERRKKTHLGVKKVHNQILFILLVVQVKTMLQQLHMKAMHNLF
jgi:hypothetical protein